MRNRKKTMIFLAAMASLMVLIALAGLGLRLWWGRSFREQLARADLLMKRGKTSDAEWLLYSLAERYPDRVGIYQRLAESARRQRRFLNVATALGRISALRPEDGEARYQYWRALLQAGQYRDLLDLLKIRRDKLDFRGRVLLLTAETFTGKNKEARELLAQLQKQPEARREPDRGWLETLSGALAWNAGDGQAARTIFLKHAGPDEKNAEVRWCANFVLGEIAEQRKEPKAAEDYYRTAFDLRPELTAYQLARFCRMRGEYDQAAHYLRQELQFNPYKRLPLADLAEIYVLKNQLDRLHELRDSFRMENKLDLETGYYCDALAAYAEKKYERLADLLALCVDFRSRRLYQLMKFASAAKACNLAALREAIEMLLGNRPDDQTRMQVARMLWPLLEDLNRDNRATEAGQVARMLLPLLPDRAPEAQTARLTVMLSEFAVHDYNAARQMAVEVLRVQPESVPALAVMAESLLATRQYRESLDCFRRLPEKKEYMLGQVTALAGSGDLAGAEKLGRRLYREYSRDPAVIEILADVLLKRRDFAGAEQLFAVLPDNPENRYARTVLRARIAELRKEKEVALRCYRTALEELQLLPQTPEVRFRRAEFMALCGDGEGALQLYEALRKEYPAEIGILVAMSEINARLKRHDVAMSLATRAVTMNPSSAAARECLARRANEAEKPRVGLPARETKPVSEKR